MNIARINCFCEIPKEPKDSSQNLNLHKQTKNTIFGTMTWKLYSTILFAFLFASVSAQVVENFSDGDFTNNPSWTGDAAKFIVSGSFELQSNGNPSAGDTLALTTATTLIDSVEFLFRVKLDFNPSSTNFTRIYFVSDNANLRTALNGYYIQLGETGTSDTIKIFRQTGTTSSLVFTGNAEVINSSATSVNITFRITRKAGGNWEVYADRLGGSNYTLYGNFTENTHSVTTHFGFFGRYTTASRYNMYRFDDVNIREIVGDTTKPLAQSVSIISATQLDVLFSENIETVSAQSITNYSVNNGIGNPATAVLDGSNKSLVHLTFSSALVNATNYSISINNVKDLAGNVMGAQSIPFSYFIPSKYDVIINELMADPDPKVGLPAVEFVELHNRSAFAINVDGWKFSDASTTITLPSVTIPADSFAVIVRNDSALLFQALGAITIGVTSLPSLNNDKDSLTLSDASNAFIYGVVYSDAWYADAVKKNGGYTLELINPQNLCLLDANNWTGSNDADGGTPGRRNSVFNTNNGGAFAVTSAQLVSANAVRVFFSQFIDSVSAVNATNYTFNNGVGVASAQIEPTRNSVLLTLSQVVDSSLSYLLTIQNVANCGNTSIAVPNNTATILIAKPPQYLGVLINEIMADPEPKVGLPNVEFVELYNRTASPVSTAGWAFSDATSSTILQSVVIPADSFAVIVRNDSAPLFQALGCITIGVSSLPSLNNTSDSISIADGNGKVIHIIAYADEWYGDEDKKQGGYTLELRNPNNPCATTGNWIGSSDASGGTPGKRNSSFNPALVIPFTAKSASILSSNKILLLFSQKVDVATAGNINNYSIDNGIGKPSSVLPDTSLLDNVLLTFAQALDSNILYNLTIQSISNCAGIAGQNQTLLIAFPRKAVRHDIVINELMADPDPLVQLPEFEYLELYNRSNKAISLKDWKLGKPTTQTQATFPDVLLLPNTYLVVCGTSAVAEFANFTFPIGLTSFPSLSNAGDKIYLKDASGNLIHYVEYSDDWYKSSVKKNGGWSLELIDANNPCSGGENWEESTNDNGGTPGLKNSVAKSNPDESLPNIARAALINATTLGITFTETLDSALVTNPSFYLVNNGVGNPASVQAVAFGFRRVLLQFAQPFQAGVIYSVRVTGIKDCAGNTIGINDTARFAVPDTMNREDIIINEILFNPKTAGVDYIELYNRSQKVLDVSKLLIEERDVEDASAILEESDTLTEPLLLFPEEYLVFTASPEIVAAQYNVKQPAVLVECKGLPNYPDNEGIAVLKLFNGITIDSLYFSDDWQYPLIDDLDGVALERIDFNKPTTDKSNWHSAASDIGFGTPTYLNSQFYSTGITEDAISIDPEVFTPDNDGTKDFTLIRYRFTEAGYRATIRIYDAAGRETKYLVKAALLGAEGEFQWDGTDNDNQKARTGIYTALVEVFNLQGKVKRFKKNLVLGAVLD